MTKRKPLDVQPNEYVKLSISDYSLKYKTREYTFSQWKQYFTENHLNLIQVNSQTEKCLVIKQESTCNPLINC